MEDNCRLVVHNCRAMNYDGGLMINERCPMDDDRSPMNDDVRPMVDFGGRVVDDWWTVDDNHVFLRRLFGLVLVRDRSPFFVRIVFAFVLGDLGLTERGALGKNLRGDADVGPM